MRSAHGHKDLPKLKQSSTRKTVDTKHVASADTVHRVAAALAPAPPLATTDARIPAIVLTALSLSPGQPRGPQRSEKIRQTASARRGFVLGARVQWGVVPACGPRFTELCWAAWMHVRACRGYMFHARLPAARGDMVQVLDILNAVGGVRCLGVRVSDYSVARRIRVHDSTSLSGVRELQRQGQGVRVERPRPMHSFLRLTGSLRMALHDRTSARWWTAWTT